jgi:hypothetical protein
MFAHLLAKVFLFDFILSKAKARGGLYYLGGIPWSAPDSLGQWAMNELLHACKP